MYTQAPAKQQKLKTIPIMFVRRDDPEPSPVFVPGECVCKVCRSPDLQFYGYLNDAKCGECGQYQNEPALDA